jgi:hypothetical protein
MRWLALTLALLGACVALSAWTYVRDRDTGWTHVTERLEAQSQARRLLDLMTVGQTCAGRCSSAAVRRTAPRTWDVVVVTARWRGCYRVALDTFAASPAHGLRGLERLPCTGRSSGFARSS